MRGRPLHVTARCSPTTTCLTRDGSQATSHNDRESTRDRRQQRRGHDEPGGTTKASRSQTARWDEETGRTRQCAKGGFLRRRPETVERQCVETVVVGVGATPEIEDGASAEAVPEARAYEIPIARRLYSEKRSSFARHGRTPMCHLICIHCPGVRRRSLEPTAPRSAGLAAQIAVEQRMRTS